MGLTHDGRTDTCRQYFGYTTRILISSKGFYHANETKHRSPVIPKHDPIFCNHLTNHGYTEGHFRETQAKTLSAESTVRPVMRNPYTLHRDFRLRSFSILAAGLEVVARRSCVASSVLGGWEVERNYYILPNVRKRRLLRLLSFYQAFNHTHTPSASLF